MKKIATVFIFSFFLLAAHAQQAPLFSQFMLNDYGLNPAVAGSGKDWSIMMGRRTQWRNFAYAPETNFASITKDFGKKGYRSYWHGVGAYVEDDRSGAFSSKRAYGSYAIHLKLSGKYNLSVGLAVGIKTIGLNNSFYNANDPALASRAANVILYPDIIPGIYLYSKKSSVSIAVRDVYKNTLQHGKQKIGTPTKLPGIVYFTINRKIKSANYDFVYVPAIQIQSTFTSLPLVQFNFMAHYRKRVGLGLSYRMHDAVVAMIQLRWDHFVVGFAYDYTISKFRAAQANSTEIMMGFTPVGSDESERRGGVAQCPKFDF